MADSIVSEVSNTTLFPDVRTTHMDVFHDSNGQPTRNGFVQFSSRHIARRVTKEAREKELKTRWGSAVLIKPALTAIDRARNWAMKEAQKLFGKSSHCTGKVEVRSSKDRGIYFNGEAAFTQSDRYMKGGTFHGLFSEL